MLWGGHHGKGPPPTNHLCWVLQLPSGTGHFRWCPLNKIFYNLRQLNPQLYCLRQSLSPCLHPICEHCGQNACPCCGEGLQGLSARLCIRASCNLLPAESGACMRACATHVFPTWVSLPENKMQSTNQPKDWLKSDHSLGFFGLKQGWPTSLLVKSHSILQAIVWESELYNPWMADQALYRAG